ncbi:DUF448 domain-containing protein [Helicobacter mustelae]|uniref:YlxR domain-containing protein n=1 Tax=Helicobacter mustelae (strain ATCC 43772 / CCUG 25715 / CIP 103759 / LMG 18044 / NCTC 12198 / R85-136P) TaxID=679897 RepID=D3UG17_HELM1|nr:DUF448 domain-containing protein [Helicobacter mustelae]CBG39438.1 Putative hypothetical protein [Helicobacter mustelae 12198]SQH70950.1 Nucleic acid binding transriptional terminator [Helicobacter mustelae]STP12076.1 Nucleic acid binding transriptional terminator [Helicobacter mustelae]
MRNFRDFESKTRLRMCVSCRERFLQKSLIRLKFEDDALVFFDGFGRSFYLCSSCLEKEKVFQSLLKVKQAPKDRGKIQFGIQEIRDKCQQK